MTSTAVDYSPNRLRICLGTAQLGTDYGRTNRTGQPSTLEARNIVKTALQAGVLSFDTARAYGNAEDLLGELQMEIATHGAQVVTKLDPLGALPADANSEAVAASVDASIEKSRKALRVPALDMLLLHRWSHFRAYEGKVWQRLLLHKRRGTVLGLGASIYTPGEAIEALDEPEIRHLQLPYNLLDWRWHDAAGFEEALVRRPDVTIHARSVFLQGVLLADEEIWPNVETAQAKQVIGELESLVTELGLSSRAMLCVSFVLSRPWINRLVIGVERTAQLVQNISQFDVRILDQQELSYISRRLPRVPLSLLDPTQWPQERQGRVTDGAHRK